MPPRVTAPRPGTTCTGTFAITGRVQVVPLPTLMDVDVTADGTLHETVHPDDAGNWSSRVTGLSDGEHKIHAVARYMGMTSPPSHVVRVIVDSTLPWSPITLRIEDQDGFVQFPRDTNGRADGWGWAMPPTAMTHTIPG